jgi:acetylornithine deacetylase
LLAFSQDINPEELKYKIVFSFTCDEETEMAAIGDIIDCEFADRNAPNFPIGCIVMEPTDMRPVVAHRGVVAGKFYVDGKISHVSRPDIMIDPVLPMLDILGHFRTVADAYVAKEGGDPLFIPPQSNYTIYTMRTHEQGRDTPHRAEFGYVFHYLPGNYPTQVLEEMDEYVEAANLKLKAKDSSCGAQHSVDFKLLPFSTDPTNPLLRHVFAASGHCTYDKVGFFTEAGYFHQAGIPVVIIGPGSILQAHVPDEFVEVNQLEKADSFLKHLHRDFLLK